jgi:hypothetical protein
VLPPPTRATASAAKPGKKRGQQRSGIGRIFNAGFGLPPGKGGPLTEGKQLQMAVRPQL